MRQINLSPVSLRATNRNEPPFIFPTVVLMVNDPRRWDRSTYLRPLIAMHMALYHTGAVKWTSGLAYGDTELMLVKPR